MKKYLLLVASFVLHLVAIAAIFYAWLPVVKWYYFKLPARGIDFFNTLTYVSYLLKHFTLRANGWKYIWFSGTPLASDYPGLHFYLILPLVGFFGLARSVQIYMLGTLFLFLSFSYLLFWELSSNRVLSLVFTAAAAYSVGIYGALTWGGSLPFFATQMFFPLTLWTLVKYFFTSNKKWLYLSSFLVGVSIFSHPLVAVIYILPAVFLLISLQDLGNASLLFKDRTKDFLLFLGVVILIGFGEIQYLLKDVIKLAFSRIQLFANLFKGAEPTSSLTSELTVTGDTALAEKVFAREQLFSIFKDTNFTFWIFLSVFLILFLLAFFLRRQKRQSLKLLPWLSLMAYTIGYIDLYGLGIPFFHGGWYRVFWTIPVVVGALGSRLWKDISEAFVERLGPVFTKWEVLRFFGAFLSSIAILSLGVYSLYTFSQDTIEKIEKKSIASSAYPEVLNLCLEKGQLEEMKAKLRPSLIDDSLNFRLYEIDATVNIWWNTLFDTPLARGYIDPPLTTAQRWGLFWLDAALGPSSESLTSSLIEDWEVPEKIAYNNTKFLLDWYAIKYLEGNHASLSSSQLAEHVTREDFVDTEEIKEVGGALKRYGTVSGGEEWDPSKKQSLNFYKIKDELVSPILMATDAAPMLHIGGDDGYDTLIRFLGEVNLGPRKLVLARGPKFIDKLSFSDLANFEALILYKYDYQNYDKAWRLIGQYVEKGGKVFIDTGTEVKESDTTKLPARFPSELPGVFPIKRTIREDLGQDWEIEAEGSSITEGIDFAQFSPLVFDGGVWNVSHPISDDDIREDARVILRHKGIPVVAERTMGEGKVIWSGFNLPYHAIRDYNTEEAKFFENLLAELVDLGEKPVLSEGSFISPKERIIEANGAKGVVFKEQAFDGWKAEIISNIKSQRLKIYKVGPTSPGFMYVRLPENFTGEVKFKYIGSFSAKLYLAISALVSLFILDYLLGGRVLIALSRRAITHIKKRTGKWWEREEEY